MITIFPQKYKGTITEVICTADFYIQDRRFYLLGAVHGARAFYNWELGTLFDFFHQRAHNLQFAPFVPLRNLATNTPVETSDDLL